MYEYIEGRLAGKGNDFVVIECGGIGYRVYTSPSVISISLESNKNVKMNTYLYLREGIMDLYGFVNKEELAMFKLLISVSGIGPKAALSLISTIQPAEFALAVATDDAKTLTRAQGIGGKTAQRLILELKDKLKKANFEVDSVALKQAGYAMTGDCSTEALNGLLVLGYTQMEARKAVSSVAKEDDKTEDILKKALKYMVSSK